MTDISDSTPAPVSLNRKAFYLGWMVIVVIMAGMFVLASLPLWPAGLDHDELRGAVAHPAALPTDA